MLLFSAFRTFPSGLWYWVCCCPPILCSQISTTFFTNLGKMGPTIYQARVRKEGKGKELLWCCNETVYPSSQDVWKHRWTYTCAASRTSLVPHTALPWYRKVKTQAPRMPGHSAPLPTTRRLRKAAASSSFLGNVHQCFQNWLSCSCRRHIRMPVSQFCFFKVLKHILNSKDDQ